MIQLMYPFVEQMELLYNLDNITVLISVASLEKAVNKSRLSFRPTGILIRNKEPGELFEWVLIMWVAF